MADFRLTDAMNPTKSLLKSVWVPGKIIVDHQVRPALKVYTFASGIICDHNADRRIRVECCNGSAAGFAGNASMDHNHRCRIADPSDDLLLQVFKCVLRLRKDQDLSTKACSLIQHHRLIEDRFQFAPLGVLARKLEAQRAALQDLQCKYLCFQFGKSCSRGCLVSNLILRLFNLGARNFIDIIRVVVWQFGCAPQGSGTRLPH